MRHTRSFARFSDDTLDDGPDEPSAVVLRSAPFGAPVPLAGNALRFLDDPDVLLVVASGEVDVFSVRIGAGAEHGPRRYVGTLRAGEVVAGARPGTGPVRDALVAVGYGAATVHAVPLSLLDDASPDGARIARALATGLAETIGRAMYRATVLPARPVEVTVEPLTLGRGESITATGAVLWVSVDHGTLTLGGVTPLDSGARHAPLARGMWLTVTSETAGITVVDTHIAFGSGAGRETVVRAWAGFLAWAARWFDTDDAAERSRLARKSDEERDRHARTLATLSGLLRPRATAASSLDLSGDPLLQACAVVYQAAGIPFRSPPAADESRGVAADVDRHRDRVQAVCSASCVRYRRVALRGTWWRSDSGPLLGFTTEPRAAVALLPSGHGSYTLHDPATGMRTPVTDARASTLEPFAYTFYRPAPAGALRLGALGRMVIADIWPDVRRVLTLVFAGAVLGLALPLVMGKMFNDVIPSGVMANAFTLFAALVAVAIGAAAFDVARALALVRVEGRSNAVLQAAIVDRLLSLPVQFFRQYAVGDLAARADAVNMARQVLAGVAVGSLLGGALTFTSVVLMWWISARLMVVALGAILVGATVTAFVGLYSLPFERRRQAIQGRISALVFELLGGIAKLHVAAAEPRMFSLWGRQFHELKVVAGRAAIGSVALTVFNDALPVIASAALFLLATQTATGAAALTTGDFIAFNAAFGAALAAGTGMSNTLVSVLTVIPFLERAAPILAASPEVDEVRPDAGPISGRIEMSRVSFGYAADLPPIIDDVSFDIRPGEFVAFVGPSGAGKSTILRLLLGFEKPDRGAVYYDGKDLASIDVTAIRRQSSVVLQQSRLLAGDIFTNIVGASPLSLDQAWHAAELAGLADDIKAMPMGMHTVVSEGGSTLSGGQRQRLLIARALVRNPRVIFFDEATSALDNRAQEVVTRGLERMQASRVVIAHRLTTVRRADRIFVMSAGRIVQEGTYGELMSADGMFQQLAARQLV